MKNTALLSCFMVFSFFTASGQWQSLEGPYGGFGFYIKYNEDYAFVEGRDALYRTGDGGDSWQKLSNGLPLRYSPARFSLDGNALIFQVAINGDDNNYALYRSDDNGDSWYRIPQPDSLNFVPALAINDGNLAIRTPSRTVLQSADNGQTWAVPPSVGAPTPSGRALEVYGGDIYLGGTGKIYVLRANTAVWDSIAVPALPNSIGEIFVYEELLILASGPSAVRSEDNGQTWASAPNPWELGQDIRELVYYEGALYFGNIPLYRSDDLGASWQLQASNYPDNYLQPFSIGQNQGRLLASTYAKGVFASADGGQHWQRTCVGISESWVHKLYATGDALYAASYGSLDRYDYNTGAWNVRPVMEAEHTVLELAEAEGILLSYAHFLPFLLRSEDNGQSWDSIELSFNFLQLFDALLVVDDVVYSWTSRDDLPFGISVIRSEDAGATWSDYSDELLSVLGFRPHAMARGDSVLYIYSREAIARSFDEGQSWEVVVPQGGLFRRPILAAGDILMNFVSGLPAPEVSADGGATFYLANGLPTDISPSPDDYRSLVFVEGKYILASSRGLFLSFDHGANWTPFDARELPRDLTALAFHQDTLYVGSMYNGVWKIESSGLEIEVEKLCGLVFEDENSNGVQDAGEEGIANIIISFDESRQYTLTDSAGTYTMYIPADSTGGLSAVAPGLYSNIAPDVYAISGPADTLDFRVHFTPGVKDLRANLTGGIFRPGFESFYTLSYKNVGTETQDANIELSLDSQLDYLEANPPPAGINGNVLSWSYPQLDRNEMGQIRIKVQLPSTAALGDILSSQGTITPLSEDQVPGDNTFAGRDEIVGSYDPNDKQVAQGEQYTTQQLENREFLDYTIRFQNTGTFPAETVRITDQLDERLDIATFEVIGNSHPFYYTIQDKGLVEFVFREINLPDSTGNEPESHGFIRYRILPKENTGVGQVIRNTADIYFDFNAPITTNTTSTTLTLPVDSKGSPPVSTSLNLFPNPASSWFTLETPDGVAGKSRLMIFDAGGKLKREGVLAPSKNHQVPAGGLAPGAYWIVLETAKRVYAERMIIQR